MVAYISLCVSNEELAAVILGHSHLHSHRTKRTYKVAVLPQNPYTCIQSVLWSHQCRRMLNSMREQVEKIYLFPVSKMNTNVS